MQAKICQAKMPNWNKSNKQMTPTVKESTKCQKRSYSNYNFMLKTEGNDEVDYRDLVEENNRVLKGEFAN